MPITRSPIFLPSLILSCALIAPAVLAQAADVSPSRCEKSFGKESSSSTIETCRLELTNALTTPKRIAVLETLGKAYLSQNEPDLAITTWNEASQYTRPSREDAAGSETWTRLQILMAQTHLQAAQVQKAETQLNNTLSTVEQTTGRFSLPAGMVQDALGTFYALQEKTEEAETAFKRSRIVYEIRLGKTHARTLETRMNHAVGLLDMGREAEAQEHFQVLASIINDTPAYKNEPIRAEVLTFLGTLQMRGDKLLDAANNYQAAFEVRQVAFGPNDIRTSQSLNNLGVVLYRAGDLRRAEVALSKAYVIRSDALGAQDPLTLSTQKNLQAVIAAQNAAKNSPSK
jgi:tetratricopeptide (TPR) repeat protein